MEAAFPLADSVKWRGKRLPRYGWYMLSGAVCDVGQFVFYKLLWSTLQMPTFSWTAAYVVSIAMRQESHRIFVFGSYQGTWWSNLWNFYCIYFVTVLTSVPVNKMLVQLMHVLPQEVEYYGIARSTYVRMRGGPDSCAPTGHTHRRARAGVFCHDVVHGHIQLRAFEGQLEEGTSDRLPSPPCALMAELLRPTCIAALVYHADKQEWARYWGAPNCSDEGCSGEQVALEQAQRAVGVRRQRQQAKAPASTQLWKRVFKVVGYLTQQRALFWLAPKVGSPWQSPAGHRAAAQPYVALWRPSATKDGRAFEGRLPRACASTRRRFTSLVSNPPTKQPGARGMSQGAGPQGTSSP